MENQANFNRPRGSVAIGALLKQQISDWQALLDELGASGAPADQLAYCTNFLDKLRVEAGRIDPQDQ